MFSFIARRSIYMLIIIVIMSFTSFFLIQLPPGDYLSSYIMTLQSSGQQVDQSQITALRHQYGLDLPFYQQYLKWVTNMFKGNFGRSFEWNVPVSALIADRLPITIMISSLTLIFTYLIAIPIGIYSATHQYSIFDYTFTIFGFMGLAIPNFLLALVLMLGFQRYFGFSVGGLFSPEFLNASWSIERLIDFIKHLPIPIIVIGTAGIASIIRVMRSSLLDELEKQYVITARTKGLKERTLLFKYPVKVALNPVISSIGWVLPQIISGATITAIVLDLPTIGALLYGALLSQDMYLAGSCILLITIFTVIGTFISDLLLVWIDPRIQYQ